MKAEILLSWAGPACFLWMQSSMVLTAREIAMDGNQRQISVLPFLTVLVNCSVWLLYGLFMKEWPIFWSNFIGVLVGSYSTVLYEKYSLTKVPTHYYLVSFSIIGIAICMSIMRMVGLLGFLGMMLAVSVYGAPLATIKIVLKEQSTETMPFVISLTAWLSSVAWCLYGSLVVFDWHVLIPSIVGLLLSSAQLILFGFFGIRSLVPTTSMT
jgi:solute carrier family 50 protein (sugar transporter)